MHLDAKGLDLPGSSKAEEDSLSLEKSAHGTNTTVTLVPVQRKPWKIG
jgi:hypothetical protein